MTIGPNSEAMRVVLRHRSLKKNLIFYSVRVIVSVSVQILLLIKPQHSSVLRESSGIKKSLALIAACAAATSHPN